MSGQELSKSRRWAARIAVALGLAAGLSTVTGLESLTAPLVALTVAAVGWLAWQIWDDGRGPSHRVREMLALWRDALGGADDRDSLYLREPDGRGLQARFAVTRAGVASVAIMTAFPVTTFSFRAWPSDVARPGFDGQEPAVGGPRLDPLPGLETIVREIMRGPPLPMAMTLKLEGNAPERTLQLFTPRFLAALSSIDAIPSGSFRGLSFDGNLLAVHWLDPVALDPLVAMHYTRLTLAALLPPLPSPAPPPETLH